LALEPRRKLLDINLGRINARLDCGRCDLRAKLLRWACIGLGDLICSTRWGDEPHAVDG
jgi:hypothetical protein